MPPGKSGEANASGVFFEEPVCQPRYGKPAIAFVNTTGPIVKDASVQRSIRTFVMRDHGKSRRRAKPEKKPEDILQAPERPKLTIVASPESEYYNSVQVAKAAYCMPCAIPGCVTPATALFPRAVTREESRHYCYHHAQGVVLSQDQSSRLSRFCAGPIDPFVRYPVEMTTRDRRLLAHAFDDRNGRSIKFHRDAIFPCALMSGLTFTTVLSNLALYLRHAQPLDAAQDYEIREEMAYQALAYRLINDKIARKEATTEDVIAAVAALACQSHVAQDMQLHRMHMGGLRTMIQLRGGIHTLDTNQVVRNSIYWLEVNGGSTDDLAPVYPIPLQYVPFRPELRPEVSTPIGAAQIETTWRLFNPNQGEFLDIFIDTARFGTHLESEEHRTAGHIYTDVVFAGNLIIGLVHRLLNCQSAVELDDPSTILKEATRIALLLYLAPVRRRFGIHPINVKIHVQKLKDLLQKDNADWTSLGNLRTWIVAMAVLEADGDTDVSWLVGEWTRTAINHDLTSATQAEGALKSIMWVNTLHGVKFREMQRRFFGRGPALAPRVQDVSSGADEN